MTDCGCDKAMRDLGAYVRGAIDLCKTRDADIREHLQSCGSCRCEADVERALTVVVRRACSDEVPPEQLRERICAALVKLTEH